MAISNPMHIGEGFARITLAGGPRRVVNVLFNDRSLGVLRVETEEGVFETIDYSDLLVVSTARLGGGRNVG